MPTLLSMLLMTTLAVPPSGPDALVGAWGFAEQAMLTLPPSEKAGSLLTLLLMAAQQNQRAPEAGKSSTIVLESLPVPREFLAPYSKTAPKLLSDRYVRASDQIFYLSQGYFVGLSGTRPEVKRLPGKIRMGPSGSPRVRSSTHPL